MNGSKLLWSILGGLLLTSIIFWQFNATRDFPINYVTKAELAKEAEARITSDCKIETNLTQKFLQFLEQDKYYKELLSESLNAHAAMIRELQKEVTELAKKK